jgi:hypothetical protein
MSDPSRPNASESTPERGSTDPGAPKPKGFTRIEGFSEETLRRFAGTTVVSVPRLPSKPSRDAKEVELRASDRSAGCGAACTGCRGS